MLDASAAGGRAMRGATTMKSHLPRSIIEGYFQHGQHKGKIRIIKWLMNHFIPLTGLRYLRSAYGPKMHVHTWDFTNFASISGAYGTEISDAIEAMRPDGVFIDIGANHGIYSLVASRVLSSGTVLSFEPSPMVFKTLLDNILLNKVTNIVPLNLAVGRDDTVTQLTFDPRHSGMSHIAQCGQALLSVPQTNPFRMNLVRSIAAGRRLYVKVDVEGFELEVLRALLEDSECGSQVDLVIVEIDKENLDRYEANAEDLYELMRIKEFSARHGLKSGHYDEFFERQ